MHPAPTEVSATTSAPTSSTNNPFTPQRMTGLELVVRIHIRTGMTVRWTRLPATIAHPGALSRRLSDGGGGGGGASSHRIQPTAARHRAGYRRPSAAKIYDKSRPFFNILYIVAKRGTRDPLPMRRRRPHRLHAWLRFIRWRSQRKVSRPQVTQFLPEPSQLRHGSFA